MMSSPYTYAHMCQDNHPRIGHNESTEPEELACPVCELRVEICALRVENDYLTVQVADGVTRRITDTEVRVAKLCIENDHLRRALDDALSWLATPHGCWLGCDRERQRIRDIADGKD